MKWDRIALVLITLSLLAVPLAWSQGGNADLMCFPAIAAAMAFFFFERLELYCRAVMLSSQYWSHRK